MEGVVKLLKSWLISLVGASYKLTIRSYVTDWKGHMPEIIIPLQEGLVQGKQI